MGKRGSTVWTSPSDEVNEFKERGKILVVPRVPRPSPRPLGGSFFCVRDLVGIYLRFRESRDLPLVKGVGRVWI